MSQEPKRVAGTVLIYKINISLIEKVTIDKFHEKKIENKLKFFH